MLSSDFFHLCVKALPQGLPLGSVAREGVEPSAYPFRPFFTESLVPADGKGYIN